MRRLRRLRRKKAKLHRAGVTGAGLNGERQNRGLRWMRRRFQVQQLQQKFAIAGWNRRMQRELVRSAAFKAHRDGE